MELPITKPSQISYGDEVNFDELLDKLKSEGFNGFIRVTSGPAEGYILFKGGVQKASSYDNSSKFEAIETIKTVIDDSKTLIELFTIRESQINYLLDLNKFFIIDNSKVNDLKEDFKEDVPDSKINELKEEIKKEAPKIETSSKKDTPIDIEDNNKELEKENIPSKPPEAPQKEDIVVNGILEEEPSVEGTIIEDTELKPEEEVKHISRSELMKKYGLKEVEDSEINDLIQNYRGGTLSGEEVEKVEIKLMREIKMNILGIPKIKGTEVMVFLDNTSELHGNIDIIIEYDKGFLSRLRMSARDFDNLKKQVTNITQMEIKKNFRGYPEIINNFDINVAIG